MSRICFTLCLAMLSVQAIAQDQLPGPTPNEIELNELPVADTPTVIEGELPVMTDFPMAVPPTIQFGNQCPHECNPCNTNLWDGYCAEKRLWCHKCQPLCLGGCRAPLCGRGHCRPVCAAPACAAPVGEPPCASVPCARLETQETVETASDEEPTTLAQIEPEEKTAFQPRPVGAPLQFWNPEEDTFSLK